MPKSAKPTRQSPGKASGKTVFFCKQCGHEELKWLGRCPGCQEWNTFVEQAVVAEVSINRQKSTGNAPLELSQVSTEANDRFPVPMSEFNRVLGRHRPGFACAHRGRPGHRQIHAHAPGGRHDG